MTFHATSGLHLGRRTFLGLPALAAFLGVRGDDEPAGALDFEGFTAACERLAKAHLDAGRPFAEALLLRFAEFGARLDPAAVPRPELQRFGDYDPAVRFGPVHRAPPVMLIEWKLEPRAVLPPHNHTPAYVLSLCLEGECRVEHYEIVGEAPAPGAAGDFELRRTREQLLRPGHATSLTPERDNVHTFRAGPHGALGVDVNLFLPGEGDWSMIAIGAGEREHRDELLTARWIGKPG